METLITIGGRLHLLLLHLPIGLVAGLVGLRFLPHLRRQAHIPLLSGLWLFAGISIALTAASGWILMLHEGNQWGRLGLLHQWLGTALAVLVLVGMLAWLRGRRCLSDGLLLLAAGLLLPVGHFGGSMTHGRNFLWGGGASTTSEVSEADRDEAESADAVTEEENAKETTPALDREALVARWKAAEAVIAKHCIDCHNNNRQRGHLNLQTHAAIMRGGSSGAAVVPGQPNRSPLLTLAMLPEDNWDRMPPEGPPLNEDELDALRQWIAAGAPDQDGRAVAVD